MGDNSDILPLDDSEWTDYESDGVGDNSDLYPLDSNRSKHNKNPGLFIFSLILVSFLGYLVLRK